MFTEQDIKAGFEAAGGKMDDLDCTVQEMKVYVDQALKQFKVIGKAFIGGTIEGKDYPGFWPNESMAKDFAAVFAQARAQP